MFKLHKCLFLETQTPASSFCYLAQTDCYPLFFMSLNCDTLPSHIDFSANLHLKTIILPLFKQTIATYTFTSKCLISNKYFKTISFQRVSLCGFFVWHSLCIRSQLKFYLRNSFLAKPNITRKRQTISKGWYAKPRAYF